MDILQIPSPFHWNGREGYSPKFLILHGTAGGSSAQAIAAWFQDPASNASTHYVIGQDGVVVQCVAESDAAYANGGVAAGADPWWNADQNPNPNWITLAIEHVKPSKDNSDNLTAPQKQASFELVKAICQRWSIPMRKADSSGGITGHFSMDPVSRANCPGPYPWDELFQFLQQGDATTVLSRDQVTRYFPSGDDTRWHCTTGFDIAYGILSFYRTDGQMGLNGLSRYGLPKSNEIGVAGTKRATKQYFERGVIFYDPDHELDHVPGYETSACYPAHIDSGPGQDPRIAQLQQAAAQAQSAAQDATSAAVALQKEVDTLKAQTSLDPASLKAVLSPVVNLYNTL